ncbi:response regulator [Desertivirga brevis]|uniref:response regulator n=1 Tax=Desertivirga brevis TaxID=2810310 RepID=UPI001A971A56|nr:response regulator [Pedobacter sp. SYSU D00873]
MPQIILIDDDSAYHRLAKKMMKRYSFFENVKCYTHPKTAIADLVDAYYGSHPLPAVILLDLIMPDVDGWDFLEMFENLRGLIDKDIPVFIITSSEDPMDRQKAERFSVVKGFYNKPLSPAILEAIITATRRNTFHK